MKDYTEEYFEDIRDIFDERNQEKERTGMLNQRKNQMRNNNYQTTQGTKSNQGNFSTSNQQKQAQANSTKSQIESKQKKENYQRAQEKSLNKKGIKYKTKKNKINIKILALALATIIPITVLAKCTHDINYDADMDAYILEMVDPDAKYKMDIIDNSEKTIPYQFDETGNPKYSYDLEKLAGNFVECDPIYSDILIYNAYINMEFNRTKNINNLINYIQYKSFSMKENNPEWYYKFKDVGNFNDYLIKIRCVDEEGNPSVEKYEEYGRMLYKHFDDDLKANYGGKSK